MRNKLEFSVLAFIVGCFYFFLAFVLLHGYWLGDPFGSGASILVIVYLSSCLWAFSYLSKNLDKVTESVSKKPFGHTLYKGLSVILYFTAPLLLIWLMFIGRR
ncbi:hypothetical protein [Alkalibacterium kapii]|uniref:Uncharacterized protein n=1 Tax=Alkalibacterium kapii TaxID=426704 RepID=A0A511ATW6_9LACT|nr:hypothetical protein [Alkalibacterium kapii]GEK90773.1 hypothetical protein AKA01nite_03950 [Alkalibacterium kapii]